MAFVNKFIILSLVVVVGFFSGLFLFLSDYEENTCEMTYMFQYPQFVRISMDVDKHFKKYGLYSYSEGHFTEKARKMNFNGIPVLFIPGNAGSHKQVRSLASVALRKALNSHLGFHFDYFTIDFNDELSGLNGALLYDEVAYVQQCIYRILELYSSNKAQVTSVILVGHSMGGIIAEGVLSSITSRDMVSLVITLAAPHRRVPLIFDVYSHMFYNEILTEKDKLNTTFITVFGGYNDFLVPPHLATHEQFNVVTTHIPKTWISTDHLCILWCKQLVLVLNRALFESVDLTTKQISNDKDHVVSVFKHHLLHNSGIKTNMKKHYEMPITIDNTGSWIEYLPRQYSVELLKGTKEPQWYMIRLVKQPLHEILSIAAINLESTNWIFVCSAATLRGQSRVCVDGMHLSHFSQIVPSERYKRRFLNINLHNLSDNFTHVVARVPHTADPVTLHVDVHSKAERQITTELSSWSFLNKKAIIKETLENVLYYELHFPNLKNVLQYYELFVESKSCKTQKYNVLATLTVPWANLDRHTIFTEMQKKPMELRLYSQKPYNIGDSSAFVKLILDPNCKYTISIKFSIFGTVSQFARFYSPLIFTNIVIVVLLTFISQLRNIETSGKCSSFFAALLKDTKPYYVIPVVRMSTFMLSNAAVLKILPVPDVQVLYEEGVDTIMLITMYIMSVGLVWILAVILTVSLFCFESTINKLVLKIVSLSITGTSVSYDWLLRGLKKFPGFVACALIIVCTSTCGGLALCLGLCFYFLKLTQIAQDVVENILTKLIKLFSRKFHLRSRSQESTEQPLQHTGDDGETSENQNSDIDTNGQENISPKPEHKNTNEDNISLSNILQDITENNELYFHFTIFSLWFLVTCINIPVVLTWAHSFKFNSKLDTDPSFIPAIIVCLCAFAIWQCKYPQVNLKWYKELSYIIYVLAIFSSTYGTFSLFRVNYTLSAIIALVTLHQLLAPKKIEVSNMEASDSDNSYEKVKSKWE